MSTTIVTTIEEKIETNACQKLARCYLVLFSLCCLVGGVLVGLVGALVMKPDFWREHIGEIGEQLEIEMASQEAINNQTSSTSANVNVTETIDKSIEFLLTYFSAAPIILIILGIFIFITGIISSGMSMCSNLKFLKIFLIFSTIGVILLLVFGLSVSFQFEYLMKVGVSLMLFLMENYDKAAIRQTVDLAQNLGKCCGAVSPQDWQVAYHPFSVNSNLTEIKNVTLGNFPVTNSCCKTNFGNDTCGLNNNWSGRSDGLSEIEDYNDPEVFESIKNELEEFFVNELRNSTVGRAIEMGLTSPSSIFNMIQKDQDYQGQGADLDEKLVVDLDQINENYDLDEYDYYNYYYDTASSDSRIGRSISDASNLSPIDYFDPDYDYTSPSSYFTANNIPEEDQIYGVGCNAKMIRLFQAEKKMLLTGCVMGLVPFLLAYFSAWVDMRRIKKMTEAKYEAEQS